MRPNMEDRKPADRAQTFVFTSAEIEQSGMSKTSRSNKKYAIIAMSSIVAVALILTAILVGMHLFIEGQKEIMQNIQLMKIQTDSSTKCFIVPLDGTSEVDVKSYYRVANSPISDASFLGKAARDTCKGISIYWLYPTTDVVNGSQFRRHKRDVITFPYDRNDGAKEEVTSDPDNNIVLYHVGDPAYELWVVDDFNREIELLKVITDTETNCYLALLNRTISPDPSQIIADGNKVPNTAYATYFKAADTPVPDSSFLSQTARDKCEGIPIYWLHTNCDNPEEQRTRVRREFVFEIRLRFRNREVHIKIEVGKVKEPSNGGTSGTGGQGTGGQATGGQEGNSNPSGSRSRRQTEDEITFSNKYEDGSTEVVTSYPRRNYVHYHVTSPSFQHCVITDFDRDIQVTKVQTDSETKCYVSPLDRSIATEPSKITPPRDGVAREPNITTTYRVDENPIEDTSFLGEAAQETCKGIPTYWMYPSSLDGSSSDDKFKVKPYICYRICCTRYRFWFWYITICWCW